MLTRAALAVSAAMLGLAVLAAAPTDARAGPCGLPDVAPLWVDFAGGPFWKRIFARPGVVAAASTLTAPPIPDAPAQLRAAGAHTVHWDNYLRQRVGTPSEPADPATIEERGHRLFDYAVASSGCETPLIGVNELFGASLMTPWTPSNAQYRANVLTYLRTLAARGARPFLAISSTPRTGGEAADWWRQVAEVSDIVPEVYVPATRVHRLGPLLGSRLLRRAYRRAVWNLTTAGVPASRVGLFLGFQTTVGLGGRNGLEPASAWFEVVKWQALAARQIAAELGIGSIWSWGWASWESNLEEFDPDKEAAACVYLWARDPSLCNGPQAAGAGFDRSLTAGQIRLPAGVHCTFGRNSIRTSAIDRLTKLTGDRDAALTALFARLVAGRRVGVTSGELARAERAIHGARFAGSRTAYAAALTAAGVRWTVARSILADQLREAKIARTFRISTPTRTAVGTGLRTLAGVPARRVRATPAPDWLGGVHDGLALASFAPSQVFSLPAGRRTNLPTLAGTYVVTAYGTPLPLSAFGAARARTAVRAALVEQARAAAFLTWMRKTQTAVLHEGICAGDDLPDVGVLDLTTFVPFLDPGP